MRRRAPHIYRYGRRRRCSLGAKPQPHALPRLSTAAHKKLPEGLTASLHYEMPPPPRIWPSGKSQKWLTPRKHWRTKCLVCPKLTAWPVKGLRETGDHVQPASLLLLLLHTRRMQRGLSVSVSDTTVSPAKTGEPIKMPSWPLENRALHHLHGVSTLREWAIFRV